MPGVRHTTITAFVLLLATGAAAVDDTERLRAFFNSRAHQDHIQEILVADEARLTPGCTDVRVGSVADFIELTPIAFGDAGIVPQSGAWIEEWSVSVCGTDKRRSAMFRATADGLRANAHVPGTTRTDFMLFRDTMRVAKREASLDLKRKGSTCPETITLSDTALTGRMTPYTDASETISKQLWESADNIANFWTEDWWFRACDVTTQLEIIFTVSTEGQTKFTVRPKGFGED